MPDLIMAVLEKEKQWKKLLMISKKHMPGYEIIMRGMERFSKKSIVSFYDMDNSNQRARSLSQW